MFRIIHCFISNSGPCPITNENAAQADYIVAPKSQWLIVHATCLWWACRDFSTQSPQNSRLKEISISTIWNVQMATAKEKYLVSQTPVFLYFCMKPTCITFAHGQLARTGHMVCLTQGAGKCQGADGRFGKHLYLSYKS